MIICNLIDEEMPVDNWQESLSSLFPQHTPKELASNTSSNIEETVNAILDQLEHVEEVTKNLL